MIAPHSVKICSLRSPEQAGWVVEAGAGMFGLIFAEARRQVSVDVARQIIERAREVGGDHGPKAVGVFVDHSIDHINRIADTVGLDYVQISRPDVLDCPSSLNRPVLLVIHTSPGLDIDTVEATIGRARSAALGIAAVVVDGYKAGTYGGAATEADWSVAREVAGRYPVILAGGLTPDNVGQAIAQVRPIGVDVSSGVETDGHKDRDKIREFVRAARDAYSGT